MNDLETILSTRLDTLADELTPAIDPRRQVADARARHHRLRRTRTAFLVLATATAAVLVGSAVAVDLLSAERSGDVAGPTVTLSTIPPLETTEPATTEPATPTASESAAPTSEGTALPTGWERRTFQGITFAVPPGAVQADDVWPPSPDGDGAIFSWTGAQLDGGPMQTISMRVTGLGNSFVAPEGSEPVIVRGAAEAYISFAPRYGSNPAVVTSMAFVARTAAGAIDVTAYLPPGPAGEQRARDLIASIDVTELDPSA
jgi:hypothetical protein